MVDKVKVECTLTLKVTRLLLTSNYNTITKEIQIKLTDLLTVLTVKIVVFQLHYSDEEVMATHQV